MMGGPDILRINLFEQGPEDIPGRQMQIITATRCSLGAMNRHSSLFGILNVGFRHKINSLSQKVSRDVPAMPCQIELCGSILCLGDLRLKPVNKYGKEAEAFAINKHCLGTILQVLCCQWGVHVAEKPEVRGC
jgi:hypothetical protein